MFEIGLTHYVTVATLLFCLGIYVMILKRNAIGILIGVELVLNASNVNLVAFNRYRPGVDALTGGALMDGQMLAVFTIVLAAAEAAVAIAIFANFYNNFATIDVDRADELRG